jgi:hypothetical protein
MPDKSEIGSHLYLLQEDATQGLKSEVILFAHGGEVVNETFPTKNGPNIRFYCPPGHSLVSSPLEMFKCFGDYARRVHQAHPGWTYASGQDVPNYSLSKSTGYHLYKTREEPLKTLPSREAGYMDYGILKRELTNTLKTYDIVLVRARGTQWNRDRITLKDVVRKLQGKGYAVPTIHCIHCRSVPGAKHEKFDLVEFNAQAGRREAQIRLEAEREYKSRPIEQMIVVDVVDDICFGENKNYRSFQGKEQI